MRHEIERVGKVLPIDQRCVATARPHHVIAARNREGPIETRQGEPGEIAGDGFDGEMEVAAIKFLSLTLAERKVGFTLLKESDEGLDGGFKLRTRSPALRIEHDRLENGRSHLLTFPARHCPCVSTYAT